MSPFATGGFAPVAREVAGACACEGALPADLELWRSALLGERDAQSRAGQLEALVLEQQTKLKAFAAALAGAC